MGKQYKIVINNGLPNSEAFTFNDDVEEGVYVLELESGNFYIDYSPFIARTLRTVRFGFYKNEYLRVNKPINFVEYYKTGSSQAVSNFNLPEVKLSKQKMLSEFQDAIFFSYVNKHGINKVVSSRWMVYGKKGHEHKTDYVDAFIKAYNYQEILTDAVAPKEGSLN